jgi:hypothetical protein
MNGFDIIVEDRGLQTLNGNRGKLIVGITPEWSGITLSQWKSILRVSILFYHYILSHSTFCMLCAVGWRNY